MKVPALCIHGCRIPQDLGRQQDIWEFLWGPRIDCNRSQRPWTSSTTHCNEQSQVKLFGLGWLSVILWDALQIPVSLQWMTVVDMQVKTHRNTAVDRKSSSLPRGIDDIFGAVLVLLSFLFSFLFFTNFLWGQLQGWRVDMEGLWN